MAFIDNNRGEGARSTLPSLMVPFRDPSEDFQKKENSDINPSPMTKLLANFFDDHHEEEPEVKIESFSHMPYMPMSNGPTSGNREGGSGPTSESFPVVISSSESFPIATSASEDPAMTPTSESLSMESSSISMPKLESSWMGSTLNSLSLAPKSGLLSIAPARNESSSIIALTSESLSVVTTTSESRVIESSLPKHVTTTLGLKGSVINETGRRSNIARFKTMMPARIPIPRSPYLTIPPGLSPAALLDSPVLLSTSQAEPSPTTGTFPLPRIGQSMRLETSDTTQKGSNEDSTNVPFSFKLVSNINKNPPSPLAKLGISHSQLQKTELQIGAQALSSLQPPILSGTNSALFTQTLDQSIGLSVSFWDAPEAVSPPQLTLFSENVKVIESSMVSEPVIESLPLVNLHAIERPSEDGYNWRKYGQKQVKGSEFPRSYYKCTHPNCQVKKKLERSHDGHITEIIYKGEHNHPKPQSTRRASMGANGSNKEGLYVVSHNADGHDHRVETSVSRGQMGSVSNGTPEPSLGSTSDVEVEGEASKAENGDDDDEPDSKRRKDSLGEFPLNLSLRTTREPRVVVQTLSEVDILDDGYRWRKYGQKIVKGNPHPRSYYKCTNIGCSVRKHVERSSTDRGAVITTYEGKHNHDVPVAKNRHHDNSTSLIGPSLTHAPHANSAIIVSYTNCNVIPSTMSLSLQGQYLLMDKMGEDRLKVDGSNVQIMPIELARDCQGISSSLVQTSMGLLDSAMNKESLQGQRIWVKD